MSDERNLTMPGHRRYQPDDLQEHFGYDNAYAGVALVELAALRAMAEFEVMPREIAELLTPEIEQQLLAIRTTEVDRTEREITKHDIRAWILEAKKVLPEPLHRYLHVMLTSYDVLDTGRIIQFKAAHEKAVRPILAQALFQLSKLVKRHASDFQIGRTHGQHAIPITIGFWLATVLNRLFFNFKKLNSCADDLVGKISGPVGAYNAQVLFGVHHPGQSQGFEHCVLTQLGLEPAPISTQILPPEPLAYYLHACVMTSTALAQFARDCRSLMRTEINECRESFSSQQSGSSTMAHKRNPMSFENTEGMHVRSIAEYYGVLGTLISEHQRDLVGSSPSRYFPAIVVNLMQQLDTLLRRNKDNVPFLSRIDFDTEACQHNLHLQSNLFMAEPLYIALQLAGYEGDAHHLVNHVLVPKAQKDNMPIWEEADDLALQDATFAEVWKRIPPEQLQVLKNPELYVGLASQKAIEIADNVETYLAHTPT